MRGADEIDELLRAELGSGGAAVDHSSAGASLSHSKPQRPGRGRARVGKFVGDGPSDQCDI